MEPRFVPTNVAGVAAKAESEKASRRKSASRSAGIF
jgi:hypothetical protein